MKILSLIFIVLFSLCLTANAQWVEQTSGTTNSIYTISPVNNDICWMGADGGVVLRTTNGGDNWTNVGGGAIGTANIRNLFAWDENFALCTATPSATFVYRTTDGGTTWSQVFTQTGGYIANIWMTSETDGFIIGDPVGGRWSIWRTTNGGVSWDSTGLYLPQIGSEYCLPSVMFVDGTRIYFGTDNNIMYYSSDLGTSWIRQTISLTNTWGIWFNSPLVGLACGEPEGMIATTDGGTTWSPMTIPLGSGNVYSVIGFGNKWYYIQGTEIVGSADNGGSWSTVYTASAGNYYIFCKARNGGAAWAGRANGGITKAIDITPVELESFTAEALDQQIILKWTTATELNNNGFEIQRRVAESEFATIGFVKGEGTTTNQKDYSFVDKDLVDRKYFYRLKQVDYNGTYEYSDVIEIDVRSLDEFVLEQNFPNPFNPTTSIGYVLKEKSSTNLILLNTIGEEIAVLVNEEQEKGFHKVDFNATNLPSGVYFYRLQAGDFVQTKKMILIK